MSGLFSRLMGADQAIEERSNIETVLEQAFGNVFSSAAGVNVTPSNAIHMAAVYACVRVLAETLASLPLIVYERRGKVKTRAPQHYLYELLHDQPNEMMTSFEFREALMGHLALWGNAYAQLEYNPVGKVQSLWPLRPDMMHDNKIVDGQRYYLYQLPSNEMVWLPGEKIWHLRGLGSDGMNGFSPISLMRQAIGLGMAAEEFGARFFGNGAQPGGVLEHPGKLSPEAHKRMKGSWNEAHMGLSHSHKVAILEEGVKYSQVGIPPDDAQFLETRKFQVQEIARIFRVPPHMLADLERATFSNIEHQSIEFVVHTMGPWLKRWEQSIRKSLILPSDRTRYYAEFLVEGLLRGDIQSRYEAYATARMNGWMSANDIREVENMNPIDGGDTYLVPLNMVPANMVGSMPARSEVVPRAVPQKEVRAETGRYRLRGIYRPLFSDAAGRILRRERSDVGRAAKKYLNSRSQLEFEAWLAEFYDNHGEWAMEQMLPVMNSYAQAVTEMTQDEVGGDGWGEGLENFTRSYAEGFGIREAARSEAWIRDRLNHARDNGLDEYEAIQELLQDWVDSRGERIAHEEVVRQNNATAVGYYGLIGIQRLKSVAMGPSTCPYCKALDGKIISITKYFLNQGEAFTPDGAEEPLTVTTNMRHSPFHGGCDCLTVAA